MQKKIGKLASFSEISLGYPLRGKIETSKIGVPIIQLKDTSLDDGVLYSQCERLNRSHKIENYYLQDNDILFSPRGQTPYAVLFKQQRDEDYIASPNFFVIRVKSNQLIPDFLAWQLNQSYCQRYFDKNSEGTTLKSIRRQLLEETPIVIPTLKTQQHIIQLEKIQKKEQSIYAKLIKSNQSIMNGLIQKLHN